MYKLLKLELKRAFCNRMFLISLSIGSIIAILQVIQEVLPNAFFTQLYPNQYPPSIFNSCMGFTIGMWPSVFFMIFPILAAIPFADSYLTDNKTGYIKNIYTRGNKQQYLISKFIAVFLSGGVVVLIPLLLNLFLVSLCVPAVTPLAPTGFFPIFGYVTGASVYYSHPFIYVFLFQFLAFLTAGIFACSALLFSFFVRFKYIALLSPFLLFMAISYGSMLFSQKNPFNISHWIVPNQSFGAIQLWAVAIELSVILCMTCGIYFIKGYKNDTI